MELEALYLEYKNVFKYTGSKLAPDMLLSLLCLINKDKFVVEDYKSFDDFYVANKALFDSYIEQIIKDFSFTFEELERDDIFLANGILRDYKDILFDCFFKGMYVVFLYFENEDYKKTSPTAMFELSCKTFGWSTDTAEVDINGVGSEKCDLEFSKIETLIIERLSGFGDNNARLLGEVNDKEKEQRIKTMASNLAAELIAFEKSSSLFDTTEEMLKFREFLLRRFFTKGYIEGKVDSLDSEFILDSLYEWYKLEFNKSCIHPHPCVLLAILLLKNRNIFEVEEGMTEQKFFEKFYSNIKDYITCIITTFGVEKVDDNTINFDCPEIIFSMFSLSFKVLILSQKIKVIPIWVMFNGLKKEYDERTNGGSGLIIVKSPQ